MLLTSTCIEVLCIFFLQRSLHTDLMTHQLFSNVFIQNLWKKMVKNMQKIVIAKLAVYTEAANHFGYMKVTKVTTTYW